MGWPRELKRLVLYSWEVWPTPDPTTKTYPLPSSKYTSPANLDAVTIPAVTFVTAISGEPIRPSASPAKWTWSAVTLVIALPRES